jgi:uncharacterized SAM-binding protein YcdF (DUF218 family)
MVDEPLHDDSAPSDGPRAAGVDHLPGESLPEPTPSPQVMPRIVRARDDVTDQPTTHEHPTAKALHSPRRSIQHRVGRILAAVAVVVGVVFVYFLVSLFQVWSTGRADSTDRVDAIVVMGAAQYDGRPSPQLAARLDHVVELWPTGIAPVVVVTGGNIPGDRFTEAEASARYLVERGVPESAIVFENEGRNSYESLAAVSGILASRGLDSVVVVTDPYHALRSRMIAGEVGLTASASSTDTSVVSGGESVIRHLEEAGGVAIGRIIGFERLTEIID